MNKRNVVFRATTREIRFLIEQNYLNKKGKDWATFLLEGSKEK